MAIKDKYSVKPIDNFMCKEWILKKGWFSQDEIVLEKKDIKKNTSFSIGCFFLLEVKSLHF